jgi:hypothetical protein
MFDEQPESFRVRFNNPDNILDKLGLKALYDWCSGKKYGSKNSYERAFPLPSIEMEPLINSVYGPGAAVTEVKTPRSKILKELKQAAQSHLLIYISAGEEDLSFSSAYLSESGSIICQRFLEKLGDKDIVPQSFSASDITQTVEFMESEPIEDGNDLKIFISGLVNILTQEIWVREDDEQVVGKRLANLLIDVDVDISRQRLTQRLMNSMTVGEIESFSVVLKDVLKQDSFFEQFFPLPAAAALSSGSIKDLSGSVSFRDARTSLSGRVDGRGFAMNGVNGQAVDLGMPLFVQLKGDVSGAKATEAATGSVAYRLGNTVIGAIQGYANSGEGFGFEGRQLESSVVASHSFGGVFLEGQV